MLTFLKQILTDERLAAIATWLVIGVSALYLVSKNANTSVTTYLWISTLFFAFLVSWVTLTTDKAKHYSSSVRWVLLSFQYLCVVTLYFQLPYSYVAILLVIWACLLPGFVSFNVALFTSPIWSSPLYLVFTFYWQKDYMLISSLLFWMFSLFALMMMNSLKREQEAKEALALKNRELLAAQKLLNQATKQAERVRIARNIHDLLGHHLTALIINLQVASHLSGGDAKEKVDQCHGLAKLLLSDVREAVSDIREKSNLELGLAISTLLNGVPRLKVDLNYDENLVIDDLETADTLLRIVQESVTNSLKHSLADQLSVSIRKDGRLLHLSISDNGGEAKNWSLGHGLIGIKERVNDLGGDVHFASSAYGFKTQIDLPVKI